MSEYTRFEVKDHIGILTLSRPPVNAVCADMKAECLEILEAVSLTRTDIWAIIICSDQKGFCGGDDTKEWIGRTPEQRARAARLLSDLYKALYCCNVPLIAAVNGFCVGLGMGIVSLCDVIIAEKDAWFQMPEVNVGTVGAPSFLTRFLPEKMARYYALTGERIPAQEMHRLGGVLKIVEKEALLDAALEVAKKLAAKYPPTVWTIKTMMNLTEREHSDLLDISSRMRTLGNVRILANDPNKKEMTQAFNEHRKPVYDMAYLKRAQERIQEIRKESERKE